VVNVYGASKESPRVEEGNAGKDSGSDGYTGSKVRGTIRGQVNGGGRGYDGSMMPVGKTKRYPKIAARVHSSALLLTFPSSYRPGVGNDRSANDDIHVYVKAFSWSSSR
jgi:hypothetical protein